MHTSVALLVAVALTGLSASPETAPAAASETSWQIPRDHPRLFVHAADLPRLRAMCGIPGYEDEPITRRPGFSFGMHRSVLERLRKAADEIEPGRTRPDDLWVPAFLHLLTGTTGRPDRYSAWVARQLKSPEPHDVDLDAIFALDACWEALDPQTREAIVTRMAGKMEALEPDDSPVSYYRFARKLHGLALALVLHEAEGPAAATGPAARARQVLAAAEVYLEGPFLRFCRQRGAMPASGGHGQWEEVNLVLAVELWHTGTGRSLWPELTESLGRSLYRYFYADTQYAQLNHGFIHDDGSDAPLLPGRLYRGFIPAVPFVIAARTRDPVAGWYVERELMFLQEAGSSETDRYLWVHLLYRPVPGPEALRRACPLAWNFGGGWVAMRSGWERGETAVLFDAGQPFWRSRQHLDAGQFQIYRKGRLAIDSGDDVTFEAVPAKGGQTTIGGVSGDWEEYYRATIAHNCITVVDRTDVLAPPTDVLTALGGQRRLDSDYSPGEGDIHLTERHTGELLAFRCTPFYGYAAADLSPAYPPDRLKRWERRLLFVRPGVLLVLDRVRTATLRSHKTWHLQLPARPRLAQQHGLGGRGPSAAKALLEGLPDNLGQARQIAGRDSEAGIWELAPDQLWIEVSAGHGRLFVTTLLPPPGETVRRLCGGPMQPRQILGGPLAGQTYFGGDPLGFEHRLWPAAILSGPNAAYTLTWPTGLGRSFGAGATWGRLDVAPAVSGDEVIFLHLLIPVDKAIAQPPACTFTHDRDRAVVDVLIHDQRAHVELNLGEGPAGSVQITDRFDARVLFEGDLPDEVEPNPPIPVAGEAMVHP